MLIYVTPFFYSSYIFLKHFFPNNEKRKKVLRYWAKILSKARTPKNIVC